MRTIVYRTSSVKATKELAAALAAEIFRTKPGKAAVVVALKGELGSGKTSFVQGFIAAAGIRRRVVSPTFILIRRFKVKDLRFKHIYHIDAYRLKKPQELLALGFRKIIADPRNIVLIEWADRIGRILPRSAIWISFRHGKKENERKFKLINWKIKK